MDIGSAGGVFLRDKGVDDVHELIAGEMLTISFAA